MQVERVIFPTGERLPMLVDEAGLPIATACEWALSRRQLAISTSSRNMNELMFLYTWLDDRKLDLFERLRSAVPFKEAELSSLIEHLRRPHSRGRKVVKLAVTPDTFNKRLSTIQRHLYWCFNVVIAGDNLPPAKRDKISENCEQLMSSLAEAFQNPEGSKRSKKHLSAKQAQFLQDVLDPEGDTQLGRSASVRRRNFLAVCLMLYLGLRSGELLSLRVHDVIFGAITSISVVRRGPSLADTRTRPAAVKRLGRTLPLDLPRVAIMLDEYVMHDRERFITHGKTVDNGFLFLSDEGEPLSSDRLRQVFKDVRTRYPKELPANLTPHSLRYTFTEGVKRELKSQGMAEADIEQTLMWLRGDSSPDSQDDYIDYGAMSRDALRRYSLSMANQGNAPDVPF